MSWLLDSFARAVEAEPSRIVVRVDDEGFSMERLDGDSRMLAGHLLGRGVGLGQRVGIVCARSYWQVVAIFGVLRAGAAYVPVDPQNPPARIHTVLESAGVSLVLDAREKSLPPLDGVDCLPVRDLAARGPIATQPLPDVAEEALLYILFTSGSTGTPKGAGVLHAGVANLLRWYRDTMELGAESRILVFSSPTFDLTQKNLLAPPLTGATLVLDPGADYTIPRIRNLLKRHQVTHVNCTPSAFYPLLADGEAAFPGLKSLRHVVLGGEPIAAARLRPWMKSTQCHADVHNTYGPTECTDIALHYRLTRKNLHLHEFVPTGSPIPNVHCAVVNDSLQKVLPGQPGELLIGGRGVGTGYVGDSERTRHTFIPTPFPNWNSQYAYRTGDRVRQLPNGMFEFLGRIDHQVKIRGYRVELPEIEATLQQHPEVKEAVAVVVGEGEHASVHAFVVLRDYNMAGGMVASGDLVRFLEQSLPSYMIPPRIDMLESFPLSSHGKIDRRALADRVVGQRSSGAMVPPSRPLEKDILRIWQEAVGRPGFGVTDHFLEVGGNSIHIAQIHDRIQKLLGRNFALTELFGFPTVRQLAAHFAQNDTATDRSQAQYSIQSRAQRQRQALARRRNAGRIPEK